MNPKEISKIISEHFPLNSDDFQDAWLHLLETDRNDINQLYRSIKKAKNRKISEHFRKKKEISQFSEHGENILNRYRVPPEFDHIDDASVFTVGNDFYKQIAIYFLKEFLMEKQKNWEYRKEISDKKLENSRRWRELRQEQLSKKYEMFQKKYELRKKRIELEMYKLEKNRWTARSLETILHNRSEDIEKFFNLQQSIMSKIMVREIPPFFYLALERLKSTGNTLKPKTKGRRLRKVSK